jgi:hypothetical protein
VGPLPASSTSHSSIHRVKRKEAKAGVAGETCQHSIRIRMIIALECGEDSSGYGAFLGSKTGWPHGLKKGEVAKLLAERVNKNPEILKYTNLTLTAASIQQIAADDYSWFADLNKSAVRATGVGNADLAADCSDLNAAYTDLKVSCPLCCELSLLLLPVAAR